MAVRLRVCDAVNIPATGYRRFQVKGLEDPILVFRVGTQLIATQGICPHEAVELDGGELEGDCITCPGHAYEFDVITGRCQHDPNLQLKRYPARVENGALFIEVIS